jgi:hypothetical protein
VDPTPIVLLLTRLVCCSAGYGVLCLVLIGGIKWLDANMPVTDPFSAQHDKFVRGQSNGSEEGVD